MRVALILSATACLAFMGACSKPFDPDNAAYEDLTQGIDGGRQIFFEKNGKRFSGTLRMKHADGSKARVLPIRNGRAEGREQAWHPNGQLKIERTMADGWPDGIHAEWHANGNKRAERKWDKGKPVGGLREWSANGKQEWQTTFVDGAALPRKIVRNDELTLPKADRIYLWDTEHHGTLLGKFGFGELKTALAAGDGKRLRGLFADDFMGALPGEVKAVAANLGVGEASRREVSADNRRPADADSFVAWLLAKRAEFRDQPKLKASMITFAPVDRKTIEGTWRGVCMLRIAGLRVLPGMLEQHLYLELEMAQPTEKKLLAGKWIESAAVVRVKHAESDGPLMADIAAETGLGPERLHDNWKLDPARTAMNTGGIYFCDWNHDGRPDVMLTDEALPRQYRLYRGIAGGKFEDVTAAMDFGERPDGFGAFVDLDGDGWEDMVFLSGRVFRNEGGKRFVNVTEKSNLPQVVKKPGFTATAKVSVADYDRDGRVDLYVFRGDSLPTKGSWIDGQMGSKAANQLLRNTGGWQFEDVTQATGTDGGRRSVFTAAWLDADNNGWPDIYVINEYGNGVLLLNENGKRFRTRELVDRAADFGSMGLSVGDFNNDNQIDLYVASMYSKAGSRVIGNLRRDAYEPEVMAKLLRMVAGSQLYQNVGNETFRPIGKAVDVVAVGWAYGPTLADLDNDGFLDIHAPCGFISRTRDKPDG